MLALLLCLQSGLAAAHDLNPAAGAAGGAPFHAGICTMEGLAGIPLADPGDDPSEGDHVREGSCLACHGLPHVALPAPAGLPLPRAATAEAPGLSLVAALPPGARAPPYVPTGPPARS